MTTLAYRNGILAADGKATRGDMIVELDAKKLRRLRDGSVTGVTGTPASAEPFIEWLNSGAQDGRPTLGGNTCVVHLRNDGTIRVYEDGGWTDEDPSSFLAWGSGWQIATTAMACGKSALEAVKLAAHMDIWSGGTVTSMPLKRKSAKAV